MKFLDCIGLFATASSTVGQDLSDESFPPRLSSHRAIASTLTTNAELSIIIKSLVDEHRKSPSPHLYIEPGGAAWRGSYTSFEKALSVTGRVPENIREKTTRYFYIGLQQRLQHDGRAHRYASDIGLMIESKSDRAVPFITTQDPSLAPAKATIKVWDRMSNDKGKPLGRLMNGRTFYTVSKQSPYYEMISFEKNAQVTVELSLAAITPQQSAVVLTLKSDERCVVITIPRNNKLLAAEKPIVHAVSSSVEPIKKGVRTNWNLLLAESAETITPAHWQRFPALRRADETLKRSRVAEG